jgi:hypothetical protein
MVIDRQNGHGHCGVVAAASDPESQSLDPPRRLSMPPQRVIRIAP